MSRVLCCLMSACSENTSKASAAVSWCWEEQSRSTRYISMAASAGASVVLLEKPPTAHAAAGKHTLHFSMLK